MSVNSEVIEQRAASHHVIPVIVDVSFPLPERTTQRRMSGLALGAMVCRLRPLVSSRVVTRAPCMDVPRRGRTFPLADGLLVRSGMLIVGPGMVGWRFGLRPVLSTGIQDYWCDLGFRPTFC
ncbi:hypothetical protein BMG523Draft_02080 [Frankia sp. BMG5.23]|nr:hypothetical protein BMG523Draft_02080 [Frankia sp. BMG5.23]